VRKLYEEWEDERKMQAGERNGERERSTIGREFFRG
jgi:hypothetical protein